MRCAVATMLVLYTFPIDKSNWGLIGAIVLMNEKPQTWKINRNQSVRYKKTNLDLFFIWLKSVFKLATQTKNISFEDCYVNFIF